MYAIIETGGKQHKVAVGDKLKVEKLAIAEGASMELERVLMVADGEQVAVGSPLAGADHTVSATVIGHGRSGKIRVFKMKRRKNYRRTQGHRQAYTEIEITAIGGGEPAVKKAAVKKETGETAASPKQIGETVASPKQIGETAASPKQTGETIASPKQTGETVASPKQTGETIASPKQTGETAASPKQTD